MPIYEDMREWLLDREKAKHSLEQATTPAEQTQRERYCEWLDAEKPEWLNEIQRPEAK